MSEVVTGEAVVVEVRVAQLPTRALAVIIDGVLQLTVLAVASLLVGYSTAVLDGALATGVLILVTVLVLVGYPVACETLTRGRTLGKLALGLRVVSDDGGPERFRQALFRGLAGVLEFWMLAGAPALIASLSNQRGKRLGDIFAGTIVIGERAPRQDPLPPMPAPLAQWAATLELSQLPDELANTARQYLSRFGQLNPRARDELGMRIAAQMSAVVTPPPPPGVPPHAFLAAVLAERRRREELRLARARVASPYETPYAGMPYDARPYGTAPYGTSPGSRQIPYGTPGPAAPPGPVPPPATTTPGGFLPPE
ncbi:RDD family protein [Microbispora sp. RL4-1S]|uniref:RDD family protein n=1 Tax=Microbispora oryzae TaxID=2806554 RepID=A0A940WS34_9ACTN|nr:RDD family protein [Microbispora oryzae]MBP2706026.1 RDD family protein [Microbispora oryzae]